MNTRAAEKISLFDNDKYTNLLNKFNENGPYYTSYPALAGWTGNFGHDDYVRALEDFFSREGKNAPLHLYVHIPFCAKLCWYCICNISISKDRAKIQEFLNYLLREIDMLRDFFENHSIRPNIREIHLGGGTPSHLDTDQFAQLTRRLSTLVDLESLDEFAMEIDPRTTNKDNLRLFAAQGVKRISFGVQDFDADVQKAINRVQPAELIEDLLPPDIRALFTGLNFDLLFGLPLQTRETFRNTLEIVKSFSPDRITLLKYAHVPDVRKHMKAIKDSDLPPKDNLPLMFAESVESLLGQGYEWVGIDHFAKSTDDLGKAVQNRTVWRNFNGFTPGRTNHLIGIGPTATGAFGEYYSQNVFELPDYFKTLNEGKFPTFRGYRLKRDDVIRRDIMFRLLCDQSVNFDEIDEKYGVGHREYFKYELLELRQNFVHNGVLEFSGNRVAVTDLGRFFLRNVCRVFDTFTRNTNYQIPRPALKGNRSLM